MDIRKWFSPINKKTSIAPKDAPKEKKRKCIIESDDDEESPFPSKARKSKVLASDSDDDIFEITPETKKTNPKPTKNDKPKLKSTPTTKTTKLPSATTAKPTKPSPKLKPVSASDYFGSKFSSSNNSSQKTSLKRKVEKAALDNDDDAFEKTLLQLDEEREQSPKKRRKEKEKSPEHPVVNGGSGIASKLSQKMKTVSMTTKLKTPSEEGQNPLKGEEDRRKHLIHSPGRDEKEKKGDKETLIKEENKKELSIIKEIRNDKKSHINEQLSDKRERKSSPTKEIEKDRKSSSTKEEKDRKSSSTKEEKDKSSSTKEEKDRKSSSIKEEKDRKSSPRKEKDKSSSTKEEKDKKSSLTKEEKGERKSVPVKEEPKKVPKDPSPESETLNEADEQKKQRGLAYRKYLQRSGPKNPGGKALPEGSPNCLTGLTFVVTGVLETIDREETSELIRSFGGKVTTGVSKNTSYLVIGDEPGQSKTKKAEQLGTPTLDEDALFKMIETRTSKDALNTTPKTKGTPKGDIKKTAAAKLSQFRHVSPSSAASASPSSTSVSSKTETKSPTSSSSSSPATASFRWSQPPPSDGASVSGLSSPSLFGSPISSKGCSQVTEPPSSQDLADSAETDLWVDKYRPRSIKNIIGQQGDMSNAKKLLKWLKNWASNHSGQKKRPPHPGPWGKDTTGAYFKAALLSGPPGIGKTTTAIVVCRELGFDVVELNASDTRSKRALGEEVGELLSSSSLVGFATGSSKPGGATTRNRVLVMDEVDGMAGNEDRGGVQELIALIKSSRSPIICLCNDRHHPKIRSLANHCFDLPFRKLKIEQIRGAMMTVCYREGIKMTPAALDQMITGSNCDIRQVLHHLSLWSADNKKLENDTVEKDSKLAKKNFKIGPWDVCRQVFDAYSHKDMSIHDKVGLFFNDYSIGPLFVQENYPKVSPDCAKGDPKRRLLQLSKTARVLADSDIVEKCIRKDSAWSLLPTQAIYSSVCPGQYMEGHMSGQIMFPSWLGKNSSRNKMDRLAQELQTHMRLHISGNKQDVIMDYSSVLRDRLLMPLAGPGGSEGIQQAVEVMTGYDLLREDWDSVIEVATWQDPRSGLERKDPRSRVEGKVKAAFTRAFNKQSRPSPFALVAAPKKGALSAGSIDDPLAGEDEGEEEEEEEEDITKDAMIKMGKKTKEEKGDKGKGKGKGKGSQQKKR